LPDGGATLAARTSIPLKQALGMYVADSKRLTTQDAKKMMAAAIEMADRTGIAISCAIADACGLLLERMDGGRFHTVHSCTTKATLVEELEGFTAAARGQGRHEVGYATRSLAVVGAGILSAQEGRRVEVAEMLDAG
jgi:glc operon protein GlcG